MEVVRVSLAALMLASATHCSHLLDQYQPHGDGTHPTRAHGEATDPHSIVHFKPPAKLVNDIAKTDKQAVPELQVGCAHGLFALDEKNLKRHKLRKRAAEEITRKRREYYDWPASVVAAPQPSSFNVWQPSVYQVSRPYLIPVWGSQGRLPVYFPPQPLVINASPEIPPNRSYLPPKGYLPPSPSSTTIGYEDDEEDSTVSLIMRNNFDRDDEDDAPIWDDNQSPPQRTTARPTMAPTRRRPTQGRTTFPPLVHRAENKTSSNDNIQFERPQTNFLNSRPQQNTPAANLSPPISNSVNNQPTARPRQQPSRCVWAIISCCSVSSRDVSYSCFEQLGCIGAFWDSSPCDSDFARAAIEVAMQYYNSNKK